MGADRSHTIDRFNTNDDESSV